MTSSKMQRLIISDVRDHITDQDKLKEYIRGRLNGISINTFYDRTGHLSLFVDYCPETKQLEITGHY